VTRAGADTVTPIYYRVLPGQLKRIQFLIDYVSLWPNSQKVDTTAVQSLHRSGGQSRTSRFRAWPTDRSRLRRSRGCRQARWLPVRPRRGRPPTTKTGTSTRCTARPPGQWPAAASGRMPASGTYAPPGGCLIPPYSVYRVDPWVFWGASCGVTALGAGAGYALGDRADREQTVPMSRLKEGTAWRTGLAFGALVPGLALGYSFLLAHGPHPVRGSDRFLRRHRKRP